MGEIRRRRWKQANVGGRESIGKIQYGIEVFRSFIFSLQQSYMQSTPFPSTFFYFYIQYPYNFASFPTQPFLLPSKQPETLNQDPVSHVFTQPSQTKQKRVRSRTYRRLSQRQKMVRRQNREDNFESKKQKKDRNIPSNIIKNLFTFLRRHPHLPSFLRTLTSPQYYSAIQTLILKLQAVMDCQGNYVRPSVIQALWNNEGLEEMEGVVFRLMLRKFMVELEPMTLARRETFTRKQKLIYMECCRRLWQNLRRNHFN